MSEPFIGEIRIFAGNFAPRGWTFCDGQLLPIAQNTALFSILGTIYGGDGRTTFGMPNLQSRSPIHQGRGPGLSTRVIGSRGGTEDVTLSEAQMPSHQHDASAGNLRVTASSAADTGDPRNNRLAAANIFNDVGPIVEMSNAFGDDLDTNGGGQEHTNMPPYLTLNFIIALTGLYPSRA